MWCCNSMHAVCDYASGATYRECPNIEQIRNGVIPLDSLPAAWWNWMWWDTNKAVNEARSAVGMFLNEMETVLCAAGVTANCTCVDNLYCAIEKIRTTVGTSLIAGAVKSSSCGGQVTIESDGTMTMNSVGNAANLTTTSKQVVGAINELKSTYDNCWSNNTTALSGKAPTAHASTETTYGVGNADCYGHLKISDTYSQVLTACAGVAASQKALACVYSAMTGAGYTTLGSTAGCALGTASAGTANTAARSDHVHPAIAEVEKSCQLFLCAANTNEDRTLLLGNKKVAQVTGFQNAYVATTSACQATFNSSTGVLTADCFKGVATRAGYSTCLYNRPGTVANGLGNVYFYTGCTNASCAATNFGACICGADGCLYGICGINLGVTATTGCKSAAIGSAACTGGWSIYGCVGGSDQYNLIMNLTDDGSNYVGFACNGTIKSCICGSNGKFYGDVCGNVSGSAGSVACAADSAKLAGCAPSTLSVCCATYATSACCADDFSRKVCVKFCCYGCAGSGSSRQNCYCTLVSGNFIGCVQVLGLPYLSCMGRIVCSLGLSNSTLCFNFAAKNTWYDSGCRCSISCTCPQPSSSSTYQSTLVLGLPR